MPLSKLEKALLRAIVELGDGAYSNPVKDRADEILGHTSIWTSISTASLFVTTDRLEEEGFIRHHDVESDVAGRGKRVRRYWKPCFDLTDLLREEE